MARALPTRSGDTSAAATVVAEPPSARQTVAAVDFVCDVEAIDGPSTGRIIERTLVLLLTLLALGLRLHELGRQSLWLDEGLSVYFARLPLSELLPAVVERDIHPPLHVLLLHGWVELAGSSEFAVRWLSAAAGVMLVPLVWALARSLFTPSADDKQTWGLANAVPSAARLTDRRGAVGTRPGEVVVAATAVVAAALTALSPFLLYFSQEARNYALLATLATLATYCLWRACQLPERRYWWVAFTLAATLTLYAHYYGALVLLFHGLYVMVVRRGWRPFLLAGVAVAVLYAPWLAGVVAQLTRLWRQPDFWSGTIDPWTVVGRTFSAFTLGHQDRWFEFLPIVAGLGVAFVVGTVLAWRSSGRLGGAGLFLALAVIVPTATLYAITANNPKFAERYLIAIAPPVMVLLARALAGSLAWRPSRLRWLGAALSAVCTLAALGASAFGAMAVFADPVYAKDDHRAAVAAIERDTEPGDAAVLLLDTYPTYEYYSHGQVPYAGLDGEHDLDVAVADLNRIAQGRARLWTLLWQANWADPSGLLVGILQDQATEVPVAGTFKGLSLRLFELPDHPFTVEPPHRLSAGFEGRVEFVGFGTPNPGAAAGDALHLGLYWRSLRPVAEELRVTATLRDAAGQPWGSVTAPPAGFQFETSQWEPPAMYRGEFDLPIEPGTPPGEYSVEVAVYDPAAHGDWRIIGADGAPVGTHLKLPLPFVVFRPEQPPAARLFIGDAPASGKLAAGGGTIEALAVRVGNERRVAAGGTLAVTVDWRSAVTPDRAPQLGLALAGNGSAEPRSLWSGDVIRALKARDWAPNDILTGKYQLAVPIDLAAGPYHLIARRAGAPAAEFVDLGEIEVLPLARQYDAPAVPNSQAAGFGSAATLLGYDLAVTGQPAVGRVATGSAVDSVTLTLYWRADGTTPRSYKVFAHLTDATGAVRAQTDQPPLAGTRPTTTWLPGEYLVDGRTISLRDLPAGQYAVRIGLYDEATGERLPVTTAGSPGGDALFLAGAQVVVR